MLLNPGLHLPTPPNPNPHLNTPPPPNPSQPLPGIVVTILNRSLPGGDSDLYQEETQYVTEPWAAPPNPSRTPTSNFQPPSQHPSPSQPLPGIVVTFLNRSLPGGETWISTRRRFRYVTEPWAAPPNPSRAPTPNSQPLPTPIPLPTPPNLSQSLPGIVVTFLNRSLPGGDSGMLLNSGLHLPTLPEPQPPTPNPHLNTHPPPNLSQPLPGIVVTFQNRSLPGGELAAAAQELGVAHPPGYPVFTMLAWLAIRLVPGGSVAWRVNLQTSMFGGVAIVFLALTVLRLTGRPSAAVLAVGMWGWCKLTWAWSITAEVFGLNNMFVALLMFLALKFEDADKQSQIKMSLVGSFMCALSLCNQHTMVVYVFCLAVWVIYTLHKKQILSFSVLMKIGLSFLTGLLPYLYLPLSSWFLRSRWTWGDQRSLAGLLTHLLRREYGTFDLGKGETGQGLMFGISAYMDHILSDLTPVICVLFLLGLVAVTYRHLKTKERALSVFFLMMTMYLLFFSWRANLDLKNALYMGVVERFWMQSDMIVVTIAAVAYSDIINYFFWMTKIKPTFFDYARPDLLVAVLLSVFQLQRHYNVSDQSGNWVIHEFGEDVLRTMPPNAIILTKGDLPSNTFRYLHLCENIRPDIQIFDQEILTYEWSVPMLGWTMPGITFPGDMFHLATGRRKDGRISFTFERFLDVNYDKAPIFACIGIQDHENSWQNGYTVVPYGLCSRFVKKGTTFDLAAHISSIRKIAQNWTHPPAGFSETSWERVTTDEMWNAKISTAYYLYDRSQATDNEKESKEALISSYQLYTEAIKTNPGFPAYWHKNYALACEKMLHVSHNYDKQDLIRNIVHHFEIFLKQEPKDPDKQPILQIIEMFKKRLHS
ncbi:transmembrane protein 260-like [Pecten maximus]|uniref:transmembrane protein 260-like n=1 Tax=Pecten maximus TaxID=6579 RepID=UPI0014581661|nr:transmembrane protein 260-like [Pecten maximus]